MSYEDQLNALKSKIQTTKQETSPEAPKKIGMSKLSIDTEEGLKKLLQANLNAPQEKAPDKEEEEETEEKEEKERIPNDLFYLDESTNTKRPNPFSVKRRKEIEARLAPIDIADILIKRRVEQKVPIIPGKFEVLFREISASEDTYIKNLLSKEYYERTEVSQAYIISKMSRYQLTISLLEINGKSLGDVKIKHEPATTEEEKAFKEKLDMISDYPFEILADLHTHYLWFKDRIKLISMGQIQNF